MSAVGRLSERAAQLDMALVGAGTHAFCKRLVPITPLPRYAELGRTHGYLAHTQITYALQAHVGMPSGEAAMRVMQRSRSLMPVFLALSASSPFFHGHETGFASYRQRIVAATRSYGIPPAFEDWNAFLQFLDTVEQAQMFESFRDMHWDIRPRPDYGTLEVRIMDAQPTIADSLALAALVHCMLVYFIDEHDPDPRLPGTLPWWIEKENNFRASHHALDARFVFDAEGGTKPIRQVAEDVFDVALPVAQALGEEEDLAQARSILEKGTWHSRQIEVFRRTRSAVQVTAALANELRRELGQSSIELPDER
jgi:carboxylate-amine ligase